MLIVKEKGIREAEGIKDLKVTIKRGRGSFGHRMETRRYQNGGGESDF